MEPLVQAHGHLPQRGGTGENMPCPARGLVGLLGLFGTSASDCSRVDRDGHPSHTKLVFAIKPMHQLAHQPFHIDTTGQIGNVPCNLLSGVLKWGQDEGAVLLDIAVPLSQADQGVNIAPVAQTDPDTHSGWSRSDSFFLSLGIHLDSCRLFPLQHVLLLHVPVCQKILIIVRHLLHRFDPQAAHTNN
jgi:hypothetical protein